MHIFLDDSSSVKYYDKVYCVNKCTQHNYKNPTDCDKHYLTSNTTWHLSKYVPSQDMNWMVKNLGLKLLALFLNGQSWESALE
jgi:hypothetical protein